MKLNDLKVVCKLCVCSSTGSSGKSHHFCILAKYNFIVLRRQYLEYMPVACVSLQNLSIARACSHFRCEMHAFWEGKSILMSYHTSLHVHHVSVSY